MTADSAAELSWRVPSHVERAARRRIFQRAVLTAVAFTLALFISLKPAWWALGLGIGAAAGGLMFWWQRFRFHRRFGDQRVNMRLMRDGFRWGTSEEQGGEIKRTDATAFRLEQSDDGKVTRLVLILRDGFESQPILITPDELVPQIRDLLRQQWSLEESPSPRTCPVGIRTLRLPVYTESHPDQCEWHWEGSTIGLTSLAHAIRAAADEIPLPPQGARPKVLEIVGTRRDGSELLIAVDRSAWFDELTIAATPDELRALADGLEEALGSTDDPDFEVEIEVVDGDANWNIYCHRRGD